MFDFGFEALVHDVEPMEVGGRWGAGIEVDVIRGAIHPGERVTILGPERTVVASVEVDEVAVCEVSEWDDDRGKPPVEGSRLLLIVNELAPSQVLKRSKIVGRAGSA